MKTALFTCVAMAALIGGTASVNAGAPSQFQAHVTAGTAKGQAAVAAASKKALALVAADTNFSTLAKKKIADTNAQLVLSSSGQKLRTLLNKSKAELAAKDSTLTVADQKASAAALQTAYKSALTANAVSSTVGNTISYKGADGGMRDALFVMTPSAASIVTAGTTATSLTGLSTFWKQQVAADTAALKGSYDVYYISALSQVLSADKIGCNAFNGYYSTDGATPPTFAKAGCAT